MSKDYRVLIIAEQANPEQVSVPLEGWCHYQAVRRRCNAHLVTQIRNREAVERAGLTDPADVTFIDSEKIARPMYHLAQKLRGGANKGWTTITAMVNVSYYYFEHLFWQKFGPAIREHKYDLVHRITPLSPTMASLIAARCHRAGVPFVMGPMNGGLPWPREFDTERRREKEWLSYIRSAYKLLPGHRSTLRSAKAIIAGSGSTLSQFDQRYHDKCVYIPENGIVPERFQLCVEREPALPLRLAFIGRIVPYKGAHMVLEAAAPLIRDNKIVVDIIGDGPDKPRLERIIEEQKIAHGVTLAGWVPHAKLQERLVQSDVLSFPSIREFGGAVVLEAMAVGLVPLIVDYGGPSELVTASTGFKVPVGTPDQIVASVRAVLEKLVADPQQLVEMRTLARQRVFDKFTWDAKAAMTLEVYRWAIGDRKDKPDWGLPLPDAAPAPAPQSVTASA
ncbi:MAG: glycosyltransferase [Planctomycetes bacterium]|nr:glycosyltransferase [Planctomycetota bacterium]